MQCRGRRGFQHLQVCRAKVPQGCAESRGDESADDRDSGQRFGGTKKPAITGCSAICARRNCAAGVRSQRFTKRKRRESNRQNDGCKGLVSGV